MYVFVLKGTIPINAQLILDFSMHALSNNDVVMQF